MEKKYKKKEPAINRREQITDVAIKLFAEKGFHGSTLDDVAKHLKVTRASLYYHIKSKEDLLKQICLQVLDSAKTNEDRILNQDLPLRHKLREYIRDQIIVTAEHPETCAVIFEQVDALGTRSRNKLRRDMRGFDERLIAALNEGVEKDEFDIKDTRIASFVIHGACYWLYHWYNPDGRLSKEVIAQQIVDLLENGYLKRPKGEKAAGKRVVKRNSSKLNGKRTESSRTIRAASK